jgi:UDP-N-acetyl-D-mannosaminuronic acid transferase (WecB/TagA/CpsF family)
MRTTLAPSSNERAYRNILGVRFFVGDARSAVELGAQGGLVVVPAGPALIELSRDRDYRQALLEADLVLTDSGYMVLLWNLLMQDRVHRVSGLEYLTLLLLRPEFREEGSTLWVMPSGTALNRTVHWLRSKGFPAEPEDFYVAPKYPSGAMADRRLLELIHSRDPKHVIIGLGGGVQEKLGLYLKRHCVTSPSIHCIGAAIGFLTGDQVRIPMWADQWILGWLFRCVSNPGRFVPRYARALKLVFVLWRYRGDMPDLVS